MLGDAGEAAWSQAGEVAEGVVDAGRRATRSVSRQINENPLIAVLVGIAFGCIAALWFRGGEANAKAASHRRSRVSEQTKSAAKVQKPSTYYDEPHEVVADSSLSKAQKAEALNTLEQDARQLAEASSEGMGGGERNKLHDVLIAEDALALPPVAGDRNPGARRQQPLRPTRGDGVV